MIYELYLVVIKNGVLENPRTEWRFLARKISNREFMVNLSFWSFFFGGFAHHLQIFLGDYGVMLNLDIYQPPYGLSSWTVRNDFYGHISNSRDFLQIWRSVGWWFGMIWSWCFSCTCFFWNKTPSFEPWEVHHGHREASRTWSTDWREGWPEKGEVDGV